MSNHDSEDDFLSKLYKQSAIEKPPVELDKQILELAKANHQRQRFAMSMNLQRVLSVAAVMVLSVYIFFDVSNDRSSMMEEDYLYPPQKNLKSAQPAPQLERLEMKDEAQMMQEKIKKEAKKSAGKEKMQYMADDISELASEAPEQQESDTIELSAPQLTQQKFKAERSLETTKAEDMLKEIRELLASGKTKEAKQVYGQFTLLFPEYPVPAFISDAFDKEK
tara:strand:+ start:514 stop:1179 length:666 start_codon:yes stop_codon:yes gene_type:complete